MIRVTIELVSAIHPSRDKVLGIAHIANDGACNYKYGLSKWAPQTSQVWKASRAALSGTEELTADFHSGEILGFDNVKRGAWDLLYLVLKVAVGSRNR